MTTIIFTCSTNNVYETQQSAQYSFWTQAYSRLCSLCEAPPDNAKARSRNTQHSNGSL